MIVLVGLIVGYVADEAALARIGLVVSLLATAIGVLALLRDYFGVTQGSARGAFSVPMEADRLAQIVTEQWNGELSARRLSGSDIVPLVWRETARDVIDRRSSDPAAALSRQPWSGRCSGDVDKAAETLARAYQALDAQRLVLLGEPGAGKTVLALLLTLGRLRARSDGDPVPVLLSASTWDPLRESLDRWIERSLADSFYGGRVDIPAALLRHDFIVAVVDGLDEIPESGRRAAIRELNRPLGDRRRIVVTCRAVEYQELIDGGADTVREAPVLEVRPVPARDVVRYLNGVEWPLGVEWHDVTRELMESRDGPLARALSTPLMISLTRTVFERLRVRPSVLVDRTTFASRHSVEDWLIDNVVAASYADRPDAEGADRKRLARRATDARRRLTFLADYLHQHGERDLLWWRMSDRLLSRWVAPAVGVLSGLLAMTGSASWIAVFDTPDDASLADPLLFGAVVGGAFAVLSTLLWYAGAGRAPGRLSWSPAQSRARLGAGFTNGLRVGEQRTRRPLVR